MKTRKKAVMWTGEHGFLDVSNEIQYMALHYLRLSKSTVAFLQHAKPLKGKNQVFYPTPPKTVLPNLKLRDWDLSLSERTSNMLRNLERTQWVTSYQMHYTGKEA